MVEALITIATGLSGAFGFILLVFIVTWLVTRHDHDYDNEPNELEQAKEFFALNGSRQAYDRMLSLVRPEPGTLQWWNMAGTQVEAYRNSDETAKRRPIAHGEPRPEPRGVQVVDAETQAMWAEMAQATELRSGGIIFAPNDYRVEFPELPGALTICDCNACRISRREFPTP